MIEYVVVHEIVHLIEPHHTNAFWDRVERILPDYLECKRHLAENGASYAL
jgi:predicted metal-dependent hydrolase